MVRKRFRALRSSRRAAGLVGSLSRTTKAWMGKICGIVNRALLFALMGCASNLLAAKGGPPMAMAAHSGLLFHLSWYSLRVSRTGNGVATSEESRKTAWEGWLPRSLGHRTALSAAQSCGQ